MTAWSISGKHGMNFYLSAVDDLLRHPEDRPSIGIMRSDRVVAEGLRAGEVVVTNGGLWMAELYEDMQTVQTGAPAGAWPGRGLTELWEAGGPDAASSCPREVPC